MESDLIEQNAALNTKFMNSSDAKGGNGLPAGDEVTTLFYTCDSNLYKSSESSVHIFSAYNYNVPAGSNVVNFCELDIISRREKLKLVPLQTISEELRCLPMSASIKDNNGAFRKKKSDKTIKSKPSEVLNLDNVLIHDECIMSTNVSQCKDEENGKNIQAKPAKSARKKSKRSNDRSSQSTILETNFITNKEVTENFNNLENAKTMYYVNLPNKSLNKDAKKPVDDDEIRSQKPKSKKSKRSDQTMSTVDSRKKSEVLETIDPKLGKIIVNKMDSDTIPIVSSQNSVSTIPTKKATGSEISLDVFGYTTLNTKYVRIHNNSPDSDGTEIGKVQSTKVIDRHKKREKKHQTSRQLSSEDVVQKIEYKDDVKKKRVKKKRHSKYKNGSGLSKGVEKATNTLDVEKPKTVAEVAKNIEPEPKIKEKNKRRNRKASTEKSESFKSKEIVRCDADSVLKIFVADKLLPSESCTVVAEDEFVMKTDRVKKRHSRRSKSRAINERRLNLSPSTSNHTRSGRGKVAVKEKSTGTKRSQSRTTKERSKDKLKTRSVARKEEPVREAKISELNLPTSKGDQIKTKNVEQSKSRSPEHKKANQLKKSERRNSYLGHFVPPDVAERFAKKGPPIVSKKSKQPAEIEVTGGEKKTKDGVTTYVEKVPYNVPEHLIYTLSKEKSKRSKSCAPKQETVPDKSLKERHLMPSKSHIFCGRRRSSEMIMHKRRPRSQRSKSFVLKDFHLSKAYAESNDKLCAELKRLSAFQHVNPLRKRFRVIPTQVTESDKSSETTTPTQFDDPVASKVSHRFTSVKCNNRDKEAILKLPIFHGGKNSEATCFEVLRLRDLVGIAEENVDAPTQRTTSDDDFKYESVKVHRRKKRARKTTFRREVSFSQLNVAPHRELYKRSSKLGIPKTLLSPDIAAATKADKLNSLFSKLRKRRDDNSKSTSLVDSKLSERSSDDTDWTFDKRKLERKLSVFHIVLGERIMEISTKVASSDGSIVAGFTVFGTEPPKRFVTGEKNKNKQRIIAKTCKLHMTFLPTIEIDTNSNSLIISATPSEIKSEPAPKKAISAPYFKPSAKGAAKAKRATVLHRKKTVSIKYKHLKKTEVSKSDAAIATISQNEHKDVVDDSKRKPVEKQGIRSRSKTNSAIKILESSLQIIKEESQSTDTSSRNKSSQKKRSKSSISDLMEQTRNDNVTEEIAKIKEVINYLYHSIDLKKEEAPEKAPPEKYVDSSSTETSGYREQFKNIVKNVKPKFNSFRKLHKSEDNVSSNFLKKTIACKDQVPDQKQNVKNVQTTSTSTMSDSISSEDRSTSTSDSKQRSRPASKIPKQISRRSKSNDVLSSGYFEKYKGTKELIECRRKSNAGDAKTCDKAVLTERGVGISSTDSSSKSASFAKVPASKDSLPIKTSVEKYVQCTPTHALDGSSLVIKLEDRGVPDSSESSKHDAKDKKFVEKSLQTSDVVGTSDFLLKHEAVDYYPMSSEIADVKSNKKPIEDKRRSPNLSSITNRLIDKCGDVRGGNKKPKSNDDKSLSRLEKIKKVFTNKEEKSKNDCFAYNLTEKRISKKTSAELDYANFVKMERHLEQVLGLYPSICKALRAQLDDSTLRNLDKKIKLENPELFSSKSTSATTIDTITEYKNLDSCEKCPHFSQLKTEKGIFGRCCHCFDAAQNGNFDDFDKSRDLSYFKENDLKSLSSVHDRLRKVYTKKSEKSKQRRGLNFTDTTSSSMRPIEGEVCKFCSQARRRKQDKRPNFKNKGRSHEDLNEHFDHSLSLTSMYSNENGIVSSCSSNSTADNWSVASPMFSRTTASMNFSTMLSQASKSSKSLTMVNKMTPMEAKKSKSLVEMSSVKKLNRKITVQHLLDLNCKNESGLMQALSEDKSHGILLMSVSSSCTVFATPSKFLARVEKHLQFDKKLQKNFSETKHFDKALQKNVSETEDSVDKSPVREVSKEDKVKLDEQSYHGLLFTDSAAKAKAHGGSDGEKQTPFYIHQNNDNASDDADFPDSLEANPLPERTHDEEDLGNFSTDSLETIDTKSHKPYNGNEPTDANNIQPTNQNYLVYSATVEYDRDNPKKNPGAKTPRHQVKETQANIRKTTDVKKFHEDVSNTLISESGYESTKSKRTASIRNFFKKGGSLLDLFRNSTKQIKTQKLETQDSSCSNMTSFSNLWMKKNELNEVKKNVGGFSKDEATGTYETNVKTKVYWSSVQAGTQNKATKTDKIPLANQATTSSDKKKTPPKSKEPRSRASSRCSCSDSLRTYKKQVNECHAYAEKVLFESQMRKEGYYKQYQDFKEIPLELLIGRKMPGHSKYRRQGSTSIQVSPRSNATSIQTEITAVGTKHSGPSTRASDYNSDSDERIAIVTDRDQQRYKCPKAQSKDSLVLSYHSIPPLYLKPTVSSDVDSKHSTVKFQPSKNEERPQENKSKQKIHEIFKNARKSRSKTRSKSKSRKCLDKKDSGNLSCTCDVEPEKEPSKKIKEKKIDDPVPMVRRIVEHMVDKAMDEGDLRELQAQKRDVVFHETVVVEELGPEIEEAEEVEEVEVIPTVEVVPTVVVETKEPEFEIVREEIEEPQEEIVEDLQSGIEANEEFRKGLTDKEVFDKLLNSYEKEEHIATRLSKDEDFFKAQIKTIRRESDESLEEDHEEGAAGKGGVNVNEVIYTDDPIGGKHRNTHFWEEKMKSMRAKEENPVNTDDIGTCFSRGFRPDNIALSGDACFSLNKQDKIKFPRGMLTDEESIIDFSERETPLDYLLALGFMVDEASNALKDEDIRSRLLAAITEARVWINKITTTQGTLLYLVAYKSRPKTMRYFLQLVEAIINRRINNAIKLDGFLRVLEKVEEGEIQMINILGADKFEDEENEEKIVKKQLRQLFITVYKIAEREAMQKGKQLSQQAIVLLRILAAKYRAGLHPHLELIARYIGQELLNTETQLEAAMIFLSRLDTAEVKLKEFEAYCDIKCDKRKRAKSPKSTTSS